MGAMKVVNMATRNDLHSTHNAPHLDALVSPNSSFSSNSSYCEEAATSRSPPRLRRSTLDMSQLKHSGILHSIQRTRSETADEDLVEEGKSLCSKASDDASVVNEATFHYISVLRTIAQVENSIRLIFGEAQNRVANVFGNIWYSIIAYNSNGHNRVLTTQPDSVLKNNDVYDESLSDPPLSPSGVTLAPSVSSKDEWGHFADFQEELADEKCFIPSHLPKAQSLPTLTEHDGCDGDDEAMSF